VSNWELIPGVGCVSSSWEWFADNNIFTGSRMVIPRIKEKLQKYPQITYTSTEDYLEIPAQSPTGFRVWIQERLGGCTVGFEGWHEEFTDEEEALNCFAFGLSPDCRLKVFRCGGIDYKWQVLHKVDDRWAVDSETGIFVFMFWLHKWQREFQNDIIRAAQAWTLIPPARADRVEWKGKFTLRDK